MKHSENFLQLSQRLGYPEPPKSIKNVSGGCIHNSSILEFPDGQKVFLKQNNKSALSVLKAEFNALQVIHSSKTIRIPIPILCDLDSQLGSFLAMEYLDLEGLESLSASNLALQLAELHSVEGPGFGFESNNFIGATPQQNSFEANWCDFFWTERLQFQLHLASKNGFHFSNLSSLQNAVYSLLEKHNPRKSLLHGDLWGGNAAALSNGTGVVFDPASYYGDAETDIAFTEVFGGFPPEFYKSYKENADWDQAGYEKRKDLYNLYHFLNHLNLFGRGYFSSCERIIQNTILQYG